jgi:hypothetical protein
MPAKSKAQQRFMGMVHAAQKGELDNPSAEVEKAADSMSDADAKDYASTKHKGLPNHVKKENMEKELKEIIRQTYRESLRESINEDASELPQATIPSSVKAKLQIAIDKIKDSKLSNNAKLQLVAQVVDALGVDKSQLSTIANKIRSKMESIQMNEISSIDGLNDVMKGQTSQIEGMKLSKGMAEHIINWMNTSPYGKKYNSWVKKNSISKILPIAFNWGLHRGLPSNLKNEFTALKAKYGKAENESVNEAKLIEPKDDWGVRLVIAINNNVSALHTAVIKEKSDITKAVDAFGTVLKNAIKETLKHKYKPHPKAKDADTQIKTFISELKKFESIVDMVIAKPTKVGVTKLDDAWRSIWNHKYGAKIGLSGELFNSIIEGNVNEVKYPTDLKVGSVIMGQGFTRLKGVDGGKYYKIVDMDDTTATLVPSDKSGNVKGSSKVRHKLDSIEGGIKTAKRGDENGIVVIKESINEGVSHEAMGIAKWTNTRQEAVQKFIDDNDLDAKEILKDVTKGGLVERVRFIQALVGTPGNSSFKWYVKNYANESVVTEGKKAFKINPGIGKAKYSISSHDGVKKHKDGSDFWDIEIFKNKVDLEKAIKNYSSKGFIEESVISEDIKSDINKFLDKLNKQFPEQEYTTDFKGGKYARIVQQSRKYSGNRSAWGFVAMEDNPSKGFKKGDLLKAAGFNTPAKGARGNILDGTAKYDKWSPVYLR